MFMVMALVQTGGGSITRVVGEFGGDDALQAAESWRLQVAERPSVITAWIA